MLFQKGHGAELLAENGRLEELNTKTMKWWKEISLATRWMDTRTFSTETGMAFSGELGVARSSKVDWHLKLWELKMAEEARPTVERHFPVS